MWKSAGLVSILVTVMMIGGTESITDRRIILQDGYSIHELPPNSGEPLLVNFSVNLRNILGVNEKDQYISLETSLRMYWRDARVKVDDSLLAADKEYVTLNPKVMLLQLLLHECTTTRLIYIYHLHPIIKFSGDRQLLDSRHLPRPR